MRRIRSDIQNIRSAKAAIENLQAENATLKSQRDELLEALTIISNRFTLTAELTQQNREVIRIARKAIENCK